MNNFMRSNSNGLVNDLQSEFENLDAGGWVFSDFFSNMTACLLCLWLCSAPLHTIPMVTLPTADTSVTQPGVQNCVIISCDRRGTPYFEGKPSTLGTITEALSQRKRQIPGLRVIVEVDRDCASQSLIDLLECARKASIDKVDLRTISRK